ncbi:unnamed protein product, partial [Durusdinium trenchii]
ECMVADPQHPTKSHYVNLLGAPAGRSASRCDTQRQRTPQRPADARGALAGWCKGV